MPNSESLEQRVARLEAVESIRHIKARYCNACDEKDPTTVRSIFTDDAVIDAGPFGVHDNPDAFVAVFEEFGCRPHIVDMHHLANPEIEVVSETEAEGLFALYFYTMDLEERTFRQMAGTYRDKYRCEDGVWRIYHSVFAPHSVLDGTLDGEGHPLYHPQGVG